MDEVRSGRIPFSKLDVLHRRNLERILPRFGISGLPEDRRCATSIWPGIGSMPGRTYRLGWRGCKQTLLARAGLERQHLADGRSRAPQRLALGRHPGLGGGARLQAEAAGLPRRLRGVRPASGRLHDGRRAQQRPVACGASAGCAPRTSRGRTSMGRGRANRRRRCRSTSPAAASTNWPPSSGHDAQVTAGRHHGAWHRADPRLGQFVLFSRRAGRSDRHRHRLVARLGRRRRVARPARRRADFAASRRDHRPRGGRPVLAASSLLYAAGLAGHRPRTVVAGLSARPGSCSAPAWAPGSTTRCSLRSANFTARTRAHRSPT